MGLCIAIIGKPVDENQTKLWAVPSDMECVLATAELFNINIRGNLITADPICFEGIHCSMVAGAILYECNNSDEDCTRCYDIPLKMHFEQTEDGFCIYPCFEDGCDDCEDDDDPDYMALLCEDPCQKWARLNYQLEELVAGYTLQSASRNGRSKAFNVNMKEQCAKLERMIAVARNQCYLCNPCFKLAGKARSLFSKVSKR